MTLSRKTDWIGCKGYYYVFEVKPVNWNINNIKNKIIIIILTKLMNGLLMKYLVLEHELYEEEKSKVGPFATIPFVCLILIREPLPNIIWPGPLQVRGVDMVWTIKVLSGNMLSVGSLSKNYIFNYMRFFIKSYQYLELGFEFFYLDLDIRVSKLNLFGLQAC